MERRQADSDVDQASISLRLGSRPNVPLVDGDDRPPDHTQEDLMMNRNRGLGAVASLLLSLSVGCESGTTTRHLHPSYRS